MIFLVSEQHLNEQKRRGRKQKTKKIKQETNNLAKDILEEAKKVTELELEKASNEVLSEAHSIARWKKNPFYVS